MSLRLAASIGVVQATTSMVLGLISIKVTSIYLGPAGLGTIGQLNYFMALTHGAVAAGLHTGLVRRAAELGASERRLRVISTALRLLLLVGIPAGLLIALGNGWLARELLHDAQLGGPILIFAAMFVPGLFVTVIMACASGAKDYRTVAAINIGGAIFSCILIVTLSPLFGVWGGLTALAVLPAFSLTIAWVLARRHAWWPSRPLAHGFSMPEARGVMSYVPMAVVNTVGAPLLQLLIRDDVGAQAGMSAVGQLQGLMRLSDTYMSIASSVFVMYYFPRFSEIKDSGELALEVRKGFWIVASSVTLVSVLIYLLRDLLIELIFTPQFSPMRDLFAYQMVGNTLKMIGTLFAYMLLAKVHPFRMALLDVMTMLVWWLLSTYCIDRSGVVGATEAYALTYAIYAIVTPAAAYWVVKRMRLTPA
jgi:O-antigen/teichoic acid export membrane protein